MALTHADIVGANRVSELTVAADGSSVIYTLHYFDGDSMTTDLYQVRTDGGSPTRLTVNPGHDRQPAISPTGEYVAYLAETPGNPTQLRVMNLRTKVVQALGDRAAAPGRLRWLSDGKTIVFAAVVQADDEPRDRSLVRVTEQRVGWRRPTPQRHHLQAWAVDTGTIRDLTPDFDVPARAPLNWDIDTDGRLAAIAAPGSAEPFADLQHDVYLVELTTGAVRNVTNSGGRHETRPRFFANGQLLWGVYDRMQVAADFAALEAYDPRSGQVRVLLDSPELDPGSWVTAPDGSVLFSATRAGRHLAYRLHNGAPTPLTTAGTAGPLAAANDAVYAVWEDFATPRQLVRLRANAPREVLADHNPTLRELPEQIRWQRFRLHRKQGPVEAWLILPDAPAPSQGWPLLLLLHGGPHAAWVEAFHPRWNAALFASLGYAVVTPEYHGSAGHGQAFAESLNGDPASQAIFDAEAFVAALSGRSWINGDKVTVVGVSYGAYLGAWLLARATYQTAILQAGAYDLASQFASDVTLNRAVSYGATPWTDWPRLGALSPLTQADRIRTPTLLLHGERDQRVPVTQTLAMYEALITHDVPVRLALFPDADHILHDARVQIAWWREIERWLRDAQDDPKSGDRSNQD